MSDPAAARLALIAGLLVSPSIVLAQTNAPLNSRWPAPTQQMEQREPPPAETPPPATNPSRSERLPARTQAPRPAPPATTPARESAEPAPAPAPTAGVSRGGATRSVACSGPFSRNSSHLGLATAFDSRNLTWGEVDGPDGSKLKASLLFPSDPKRRLEVLWRDDDARLGTALVVIGGQSTWTGPKGLKLGMPLAALEKANGKPFKVRGLDQSDPGGVLDWQGGAFDSVPGGCTVGLRLAADPKVGEAIRGQAVGELMSNDAALKALKPTVAEILVGYPAE